ncbi:hypothetical protein BMS3Abin12_01009 [bacterium BMS3Abin12]|nr:hypothetical protein BMS3Abin12_01009 [bacterium BMS3Abin12]
MERAPDRPEHLPVLRLRPPARKLLAQRRQLLIRLLDKDLENLRVHFLPQYRRKFHHLDPIVRARARNRRFRFPARLRPHTRTRLHVRGGPLVRGGSLVRGRLLVQGGSLVRGERGPTFRTSLRRERHLRRPRRSRFVRRFPIRFLPSRVLILFIFGVRCGRCRGLRRLEIRGRLHVGRFFRGGGIDLRSRHGSGFTTTPARRHTKAAQPVLHLVQDGLPVPAALDDGLEVILDPGDDLRERFLVGRLGGTLAACQSRGHIIGQGLYGSGGARQIKDLEAAFEFREQPWDLRERLATGAGIGIGSGRLQVGKHRRLDPRDVLGGLARHGQHQEPELRIADPTLVDVGLRAARTRLGSRRTGLLSGAVPDILVGCLGPRGHLIQRCLHQQDGLGDLGEFLIARIDIALGDRLDAIRLLLSDPPQGTQRQHAKGVRHPPQDLRHPGQVLGIARRAAHIEIETVLDGGKILLDRLGDRAQGVDSRPHDSTAGERLARQEPLQFECVLQGPHPLAPVRGARDVVEEIAQQIRRQFRGEARLAIVDQPLDPAIHLPEQQLHRDARIERARAQGLHQTGADPPQPAHRLELRDLIEVLDDRQDPIETVLGIAPPVPAEQAELQVVTQAAQQPVQLAGVARKRLALARRRHRHREVGVEQRALREQRLPAQGAHVVEQRQQDDGHVRVSGLHVVEVVGQLQDAAHEDLVGLAPALHGLVQERAAESLEFLGEQCGAVHLDHLQRSARLMQVGRAKLQLRGVAGILDECLQRETRLADRLVEFLLHPVQGAVVHSFVARHHALIPYPLCSASSRRR